MNFGWVFGRKREMFEFSMCSNIILYKQNEKFKKIYEYGDVLKQKNKTPTTTTNDDNMKEECFFSNMEKHIRAILKHNSLY